MIRFLSPNQLQQLQNMDYIEMLTVRLGKAMGSMDLATAMLERFIEESKMQVGPNMQYVKCRLGESIDLIELQDITTEQLYSMSGQKISEYYGNDLKKV